MILSQVHKNKTYINFKESKKDTDTNKDVETFCNLIEKQDFFNLKNANQIAEHLSKGRNINEIKQVQEKILQVIHQIAFKLQMTSKAIDEQNYFEYLTQKLKKNSGELQFTIPNSGAKAEYTLLLTGNTIDLTVKTIDNDLRSWTNNLQFQLKDIRKNPSWFNMYLKPIVDHLKEN